MKEKIVTDIDLCIRGDSLDINDITRRMGFEPSRAFAKGDPYSGKEKRGEKVVDVIRARPTGVWHFRTSKILKSNDVADHVDLLIEKCSASKGELMKIVESSDLHTIISIWVVGMSFGLPAQRFHQLSEISDEITISCFDETPL